MTTKSQQAFESWLSTLPRRPHTPAAYDWCFATWQASRKQALKDASAAFFGEYPNYGDNIRAFKELLND